MTSGLLYAEFFQRDYYHYLFWVIHEENYILTGNTTLLNEVWAPDNAIPKTK